MELLGTGNTLTKTSLAALLGSSKYSNFPKVQYKGKNCHEYPDVEKENLFVLFNANTTQPPTPPKAPQTNGMTSTDDSAVRKAFSETWLFEDMRIGPDGEKVFREKVPDSITTFVLNGFAIHPDFGLAIAEPAQIKIFKNFFITPNLPHSIRMGEILEVQVFAFNYIETDPSSVDVQVTLDNVGENFKFYDMNRVGSNCNFTKVDRAQRTQSMKIASGNGESTVFLIKPLKSGILTLRLSGKATVGNDEYTDIIEKTILVIDEGVRVKDNVARMIDLKSGTKPEKISLNFPVNTVPSSISIQASVIGDLLGPIYADLRFIE